MTARIESGIPAPEKPLNIKEELAKVEAEWKKLQEQNPELVKKIQALSPSDAQAFSSVIFSALTHIHHTLSQNFSRL
jgi:hypothetical protein